MKRCTSCILPQSYPGIAFDQAGVCNYCRDHQRATLRPESELTGLLDSYQGRGNEYDCVVGVSGGKDSSYALYYLVKTGKLRVLAYMADHGFVHETAKANARAVAEALGVPLVMEQHNYLRRLVKHNLLSWLRKPLPAMLPMLCCGCRLGMYGGLLKYARAHDIPLVALGIGNPIEVYPFKSAYFAENPLGRMGRNTLHSPARLLGLLYEAARNPSYFPNPVACWTYVSESLYHFHVLGLPMALASVDRDAKRSPLYPGQRLLYLGKYTGWDEEVIESVLRDELGWQRAADRASAWHFDCLVSVLLEYLYLGTAGFSEVDDKLSMMVREGMVTRAEAVSRLEREGTIPGELVASICGQMGIAPPDLARVLECGRRTGGS